MSQLQVNDWSLLQLAKAVVTAIGSSVAQFWTNDPPQNAVVSLGAELLQFFHTPDNGSFVSSIRCERVWSILPLFCGQLVA